MHYRLSAFIFALVVGLVVHSNVQAQYLSKSAKEPSVVHARAVAQVCPGQWETPACLKAVSESTLVLAANYGGILQSRKQNQAVETLKEHCAAGTAAAQEGHEYPAYAMKSAWVECANIIYDLSEQTGIKPNQSHYQLLVGPILCLEQDRRCAAIEDGLRRFK